MNILDCVDDGFSGQSMPNGVLPRPTFAIVSGRSGASKGIASVSFDLPKRRHSVLPPFAAPAAFESARSFRSPAKPGCEIRIAVWEPLVRTAVLSVWLCFHNFMAIGSGLILMPFHHNFSSPWLCNSR
jgi:hypothetical protein